MIDKTLALKAYEKIDHTCCLNNKTIKFNIDQHEHADCKDVNEMVDCLDIIKQFIEQYSGSSDTYYDDVNLLSH